jgi:lipopolysaccharide export LptBFGC system permease protein LptF
MRILTRYILREVVAHALIGAAIFTFVLFTRDLGRILELVVRASAPLPSVAEIFLFTVPLALTYTIPMSVLVGILIGLSRLAADSEITAMRASGMSIWSFLRALSIFVIAAWLLALANGIYLAPYSQAALVRLEDQLRDRRYRLKSSRGFSTKVFRGKCSMCRMSTADKARRCGRAFFSRTHPTPRTLASLWPRKAS